MLTTNCPSCKTAFRVTPEQLKARAGKVRCGHCQAVFNALESLDDLPASLHEGHETATEATAPEAEVPPPAESSPALSPPAPEYGTPTEPAAADLLLEAPIMPAARTARGALVAWSLAVVLALGLTTVHGAYLFRAELAASQPELRPVLEELCNLLDCDIPLPRKAELVSIETSDLHPDPQRKAILVLAASLKNRAPFVQAYPHLEITLTDTQDQPILRKVLAPTDYLPPGHDANTGFAGNGDLAVNLWIEPGLPGASGYRLYLFYP